MGDLLSAFRAAAEVQAKGDAVATAAAWRAVVDRAPDSGEAWRNYAETLIPLNRIDEALAAYGKAAELRPDAIWARRGFAALLHMVGRWDEARAHYERSIALQPGDPRLLMDYGHLLLGLGDYAAGWPLLEYRKGLDPRTQAPNLPNEWQGEPLAGRSLLVWPEQGFGDLIQFARFLSPLREAAGRVTFVVPPELEALFAGLGVGLVVRGGSTTLEVPDAWTLALSTAGRLGVTLANLPAAPYLSAPPERLARWRGTIPPRTAVIAWRGRPTPNPFRSMPQDLLSPLLAAHGFQPLDLSEPTAGVNDFADVAAIVSHADLVITIDTALAHLAGAMGKPCWVLLPWRRLDWRWMQGRADSAWYPSMRLFRQPYLGGWPEVMAEVEAALEALPT